MFINIKRVLVIVCAIIGILTAVIVGFLYAGGILITDDKDELYQGILSERYLTTAAIVEVDEPIDDDTMEIIRDTYSVGVIPGETSGTDDEETSGSEGDGSTSPLETTMMRVLLFLPSNELAASGVVATDDGTFALLKSVNLMSVERAGDFPHMNRDRDMLTYRDVDDVLKEGGYFRVERDGHYISYPIRLASLIQRS
ncbi:MAG: hypothetical protein LBO70_08690 [Clostridiales Family XIII bacterium]|jgi:hypothetical protein|nr:hypothetical protein [Clostridiales Family XIII bacterium]